MVDNYFWGTVLYAPSPTESEIVREPDVFDETEDANAPAVYLVIEGEYSDRQVTGVYDEAHKEAAFELARSSHGYVEKHSYNREADRLAQGLKPHTVYMWRNGDSGGYVETTGLSMLRHDSKLNTVHRMDGERKMRRRVLFWHGWAKDKTHAIRRANEKRIQMIAAGQWEEDVEEN